MIKLRAQSPSHGANTGSNPVRDTNLIKGLRDIPEIPLVIWSNSGQIHPKQGEI